MTAVQVKEVNSGTTASSVRVIKLGVSEVYKIADKQRVLGSHDVVVKLMPEAGEVQTALDVRPGWPR